MLQFSYGFNGEHCLMKVADDVKVNKRNSSRRRLLLAFSLFFLSPLIGEFLMGNQPITALGWLLIMAPVYGGAALLIREFTRRYNKGWPTIILLSVAYALLFEGIIDQMFFNPAYLGLSSFEGYALIPGLGASASLVQGSITVHTIWSMCVPIMLVEAFDSRPQKPWLGRFGLTFVIAVFILGSVFVTAIQYEEFNFFASSVQLFTVAAIVLVLCVLAFRLRGQQRRTLEGKVPSVRRLYILSLLVTSLYSIQGWFLVGSSNTLAWTSIFIWLLCIGLSVVRIVSWTQRKAWSDTHTFALAGGALLCYAWTGYIQGIFRFGFSPIVLLGNVIFSICAVVLLVVAVHKLKEHTTPPQLANPS